MAGSTNKAHRDRTAYLRVCSGRFERGMQVTHAASGRTLSTKYAHTAFAADRNTVDEAFPGDVVGLVNAGDLRAGDTLFTGPGDDLPGDAVVRAGALPGRDGARTPAATSSSAPASPSSTTRAWCRCCAATAAASRPRCSARSGRCSSRSRCAAWPTSTASRSSCSRCAYSVARRTDAASRGRLNRLSGVEVLERADGSLIALVEDPWRLRTVLRDHPTLTLAELVGSTAPDRLV